MRCHAWLLAGSGLRASKVSPVAALSSRWKSASAASAAVRSLADCRLLTVDGAVDVVDQRRAWRGSPAPWPASAVGSSER